LQKFPEPVQVVPGKRLQQREQLIAEHEIKLTPFHFRLACYRGKSIFKKLIINLLISGLNFFFSGKLGVTLPYKDWDLLLQIPNFVR